MARIYAFSISALIILAFVGPAVPQTQMLKGFGPLFTFLRPPFIPPPPNQIRRMGAPHIEPRSGESLEVDVDRVNSDESVEKRFTLSIKPDSVSISEPDNASDEELVNFPNDTQEDDRPVNVPIEIVKKEEPSSGPSPTNATTAERDPILGQFNTLPNETTVNIHSLDLIPLSPSPVAKVQKAPKKKPQRKTKPSEIDDYPVFDISLEDDKPLLSTPMGPFNPPPSKKKKKNTGYKINKNHKHSNEEDEEDESNESGEEEDDEEVHGGESESRERFIQYEGIADSLGYGRPPEGPPQGQESHESHDEPEGPPPPPPPQRPSHDGPPPPQHNPNPQGHHPTYYTDYGQNYYGPTPTEKPSSGILHSVASAGQGLMSWASYPFRSIPKISLELGAKIKQEEQQAQAAAAAQQQGQDYDALMKAYADLLQSKTPPSGSAEKGSVGGSAAVAAAQSALTPTGSSSSSAEVKTTFGSGEQTKGEIGGGADDPAYKHAHWFKKSEKKANKKAKKAWKKHHKRPTYHKYSGGWGPGPAPKLPYYNYEAHNALTHNLGSYNNQDASEERQICRSMDADNSILS